MAVEITRGHRGVLEPRANRVAMFSTLLVAIVLSVS